LSSHSHDSRDDLGLDWKGYLNAEVQARGNQAHCTSATHHHRDTERALVVIDVINHYERGAECGSQHAQQNMQRKQVLLVLANKTADYWTDYYARRQQQHSVSRDINRRKPEWLKQ
jgi:hypothetical protein